MRGDLMKNRDFLEGKMIALRRIFKIFNDGWMHNVGLLGRKMFKYHVYVQILCLTIPLENPSPHKANLEK